MRDEETRRRGDAVKLPGFIGDDLFAQCFACPHSWLKWPRVAECPPCDEKHLLDLFERLIARRAERPNREPE